MMFLLLLLVCILIGPPNSHVYDIPMNKSKLHANISLLYFQITEKKNENYNDSTRTSVSSIIGTFVDQTSFQGLNYIKSNKSWLAKALWVIVFIACTVLFSINFYYIVTLYFSYPTQTRVEMGYEALPFPSVTICNLNSIRKSKAHLVPELREYIRGLQPNPGGSTGNGGGSGTAGGSTGNGAGSGTTGGSTGSKGGSGTTGGSTGNGGGSGTTGGSASKGGGSSGTTVASTGNGGGAGGSTNNGGGSGTTGGSTSNGGGSGTTGGSTGNGGGSGTTSGSTRNGRGSKLPGRHKRNIQVLQNLQNRVSLIKS